MQRRHLLKLAVAATATPLLTGRAFAAPGAHPRLLVVFMRGAYDAANLLVPVSSDLYYRSRPTIAVPKPDPGNPDTAIPLNGDWGLHPALRDSIYPLWQKGQVAFAPYAGTEDMTRSHFGTQATIEMGQPIQGARDPRSGFMGRLVAQLGGAKPISFTSLVPTIFQGGRAVIPNIAINNMGKSPLSDRETKLLVDMYRNDPLGPSVQEGFSVQDAVFKAGSEAASDRGAVSVGGFEGSVRKVARLMLDRFNVAYLDVGGWDTHIKQGGAKGYLAYHLDGLGRGLAGFADELGPDAWNHTVVVVISEFGRTLRENGEGGTDHGHGSVYWVMGGGVRGGRVLGDQGPITEAILNENRDYPVLINYRGLFGGLFQRMYGLDQTRLEKVFPSAAPLELNIV